MMFFSGDSGIAFQIIFNELRSCGFSDLMRSGSRLICYHIEVNQFVLCLLVSFIVGLCLCLTRVN